VTAVSSLFEKGGKKWRALLQVAEGEGGQEEGEAALFPRKTARLVLASPLDRIRDLR